MVAVLRFVDVTRMSELGVPLKGQHSLFMSNPTMRSLQVSIDICRLSTNAKMSDFEQVMHV